MEFDTATVTLGETWIKVMAFLSHERGYKRTFHIDMPADGKGAQGSDVMTEPTPPDPPSATAAATCC